MAASATPRPVGAATSTQPPAATSPGRPRLSLATLDPRSLFPTPENLAAVTNVMERVLVQLEEDRAMYERDHSQTRLREMRNETLQYYGLLNDWLAGAQVLLQQQQQQQMQQQAAQARPSPPNGTNLATVPQVLAPGTAASTAAIRMGLRLEPAREVELPVEISAPARIEVRKCLVDSVRGFVYVKVKKLRDTIYGAVRVYQIARMDGNTAKFLNPPEQVAIKLYDKTLVSKRKSRDGHDVQEDPLKELAIQQRLSHPGNRHVMPILACLESPDRYFAIFPFVRGGELFDYVQTSAPLTEAIARHLFKRMLEAVQYCHLAGVCHRDISLENFLLGGDRSQTPLLIDFGLSVVMEPDGDNRWKPIPHSGPVGKVFYMDPVLMNRSSPTYSGLAVDVWSLGVSLFIMLTGVPPWPSPLLSDERFRAIVLNKRLGAVAAGWGFPLSPQAADLLQRMLDIDPVTRLTTVQIYEHDWLKMS